MNATRAESVTAEQALEPLFRWLRAAADTGIPLGVAPGLRATGDHWCAAAELAAAPHERLGPLLAEAERRWDAPPHVAAAVWWKQFSYWTSLPVALGWALNRRVPILTAATTMLHTPAAEPRMQIATSELRVAIGADDELGTIIGDTLLRDLHAPLIEALHALTRTGRRGLWGSVAEALADPLVSLAGDLLDDPGETARTLLESIGEPVAGLVELPVLRRRTCCLWVTLPSGAACPTCCVDERRSAGAGT